MAEAMAFAKLVVSVMFGKVAPATAGWAATLTAIAVKFTGIAIILGVGRGADMSRLDRGREVALSGGALPHEIVYGRQKVAGVMVDHHGWKAGGGAGKLNRYARVQVFAAHECDAIEAVLMDGKPVTYNASTGEVITQPYAGKLWVFFHTGARDQTVDANFISQTEGWWTSTRRGRGRCWGAYVMKTDAKAFPSGPPDMTVILRGKKVYDTRLDDTSGGTGSHRATDPATWTWTENAALNLVDHYRSEYGELQNFVTSFPGRVAPVSFVRWPNVITAANICDETVNLPVIGTESRYKSAGRFFSNDDPRLIFEQMLEAMSGRAARGSGQLVVYAGAYYAPTVTLTAANLAGDFSLQHTRTRSQAFDAVRGNYVSATTEYRPTSYPQVVRSGVTGAPVFVDKDFPFVPSGTQCQRLAQILLNRAIYARRISAPLDMIGLATGAGHTIALSLPERRLSDTEFEIQRWQMTLGGDLPEFLIEANETGPDVYGSGTIAALPAPPVLADINNDLIAPSVPEIATLQSWDGVGYTITIEPPEPSEGVTAFEIYESGSELSDNTNATVLAEAVLAARFSGSSYARAGVSIGATVYLYVRAIASSGLFSPFTAVSSVLVSAVAGDSLGEINDTVHGVRGGGNLHADATTSEAGFMSAADKTKLNGVATGATANSSDVFLRARENHTGTQSADTLTDGSERVAMTAAERTKLAGIEANADVNPTSADILAAVKAELGDLSGLGSGDPGAAPGTYNPAHSDALRSRLNALISALD